MAGDEITVLLQSPAGGDLDELEKATLLLRQELLELEVAAVDFVDDDDVPPDAKGIAALGGWLVVHLGTKAGLKAIVEALRVWATRTRRDIEVTVGGDVLKLTGVTSTQQGQIIDAWIARHSAGA